MILIVTDGVGLTTRIAVSSKNNRAKILKKFYDLQLQALVPYVCKQGHWKIVKTTGDGLLLKIDDMACNNRKCWSNFTRVLDALRHMHKIFEPDSLSIRSVCHWTDEPIEEIDINYNITNIAHLCTKKVFKDDIFGLEVIRLMRIAALVQGPFCIITYDFLKSLIGFDDNFSSEQKRKKIDTFNSNATNYAIQPEIPLPYLRGFDDPKMDKAVVKLENPYFVWEVKFK